MRPLLALVFSLAYPSYVLLADQDKLSISYDKITTLVFEEEIIDVELGSQEYGAKVKGRYLLLRAAKADAARTSIFVRYGNNGQKEQHHYVAEIYPDQKAPLQYSIPSKQPKQATSTYQEKPSPFTDTLQGYFDIGVVKNGIKVIVNKLLLSQGCIWIQLYIENNTSRDLYLDESKFEYVTIVRRGLWGNAKKTRLIRPLVAADSIVVLAKQGRYVALAVPLPEAKEGLKISLEGKDTEEIFECFIPAQVLRADNRS